jgi:hypothetical protein
MARGSSTDLAGLLHDVETHAVVDGTKVTAHCHCVKLDGNGRPRVDDLVRVVAEHILDYAIPRSEIRRAQEEFNRSKSTQKLVRLHNTAKSLFTDLEQSGEGGELLLFALAEKLLRLPQLLCKMSLKTNSRMHIHGADGLHAGVDAASGRLVLYWGESKVYADVTGAIRECLASVAPMLTTGTAGQRDLQLLQRHADLADEPLECALKKFLDPDSEEFNALEFRGLCLVGFDSDAYPRVPSVSDLSAVTAALAAGLPDWKAHVGKRVVEEKVDSFAMHFLFVPFPSADGFRQALRQHLELPAKSSTTTAVSAIQTASTTSASTDAAKKVTPASPSARPSSKRGNRGAR